MSDSALPRTSARRGPSEDSADAAAIRIAGLTYAYPGADEPAVRDLDVEIERGEIFGFLGPSGAGKSTTQNVVIGLLDGYEGDVEVLGRPLGEWGREYYERIGVSFEAPNHYRKLTGRENLELFASLYDGPTRDPDELLAAVGLADAADRRVDAYSKGMRMRLTVVRALLHDPELLFLDEPTGGLDPGTARSMKDLVGALREGGKTVFLTTHDMTVADELCDRVGFIVDGRLVAVDAPKALKRRYGSPAVRVEYRENGAVETAEFDLAGLAGDPEFEALLDSGAVESIHSAEATLEDVFVEITGRSLR